MKKLLIALALCVPAFAQFSTTARHIIPGASLPATCRPQNGDVYWLTAPGPVGSLYGCTALNSWTLIGGGVGTVTVVGAGSLTSTALVTGGGSQALQTPCPGCTLTAGGTLTLNGSSSGAWTALGITSGSATLGVADIAGSPNRINWPIATGAAGGVWSTDGGNPQQTSWVSLNANVPWVGSPASASGTAYICNTTGTLTRIDGTGIGSTEPGNGQQLMFFPDVANTGSFTITTGGTARTAVSGSGSAFAANDFDPVNDNIAGGRLFVYSLPDLKWVLQAPRIAAGTGLTLSHQSVGFLNNSISLTIPVVVSSGGSGTTTLAANGVVLGQGTSPVHVSGAGTAGQVFTSNGAGVDPTFQASASFDPLDTTTAYGRDEFLHSGTATDVGELRWQTTTGTGGTAFAYLAGDVNHPGIFEMASAIPGGNIALSFSGTLGFLNPFGPPASIPTSWEYRFVVRPVAYSGGTEYDVGLDASVSTTPALVNSVLVRALQGTDTNWTLKTCSASTCSTQASTTPIVANVWAYIAIKSTAAGTVVATITQNGVTSTATLSTNVPAVAVQPWMLMADGGAVSTGKLDVDMFAYKITGVVRY